MSIGGLYMIKILVVDDHELIIESIKSILKKQEAMQIIASASDGEEALKIIRKSQPDLVITDVYMPKINGMELTRSIKAEFPEVKVLGLTIFDDAKTITSMLEAGVDGIVKKDLSKEVLISTITNTMHGMTVLDNAAYRTFIQLTQSDSFRDQKTMHENNLTITELTIIRCVAQGLSNTQIAEKLFLSESTVKHRLTMIMTMFSVDDRVQLAVAAAKKGIV